ncbi:MAG: hypothetical protein H8E98_02990 [Bacteroidetes bacterium]|nr:hypothetical protein [Bacteroidota bacterium]
MKTIECKCCGIPVEKCEDSANQVKCSMCVIEDLEKEFPLQKINKTKSDKPRGWHLMKQYVHHDGTVFEFGKENKKLKGTLNPTKKIKKKTKKKLTDKEIEFNRLDIINDIKKLKKKLKAEINPKKMNRIHRDINKKQIELAKIKQS